MSQWISVEDRLPEHGTWYLVSVDDKARFPDGRATTMAFFDHDTESGQHFWLAHNDTESEQWDGVTHWMPLPPPETPNE